MKKKTFEERYNSLMLMKDAINEQLKRERLPYRVFWTLPTNQSAKQKDIDYVLFWVFELVEERECPVAQMFWMHQFYHTNPFTIYETLEQWIKTKEDKQ